MHNEYNKTDRQNVCLWGWWCSKCNTFRNKQTDQIEAALN